MEPTGLRDALRGVISFAPTPFTPEDEVDLDGLGVVVGSLAEQGWPVAVLGAVGEYASLDLDESRSVMGVAVAAAGGRVPVIVGIGHGTKLAAGLAEEAARAGAAGLLVNPFSFVEPSRAGLVAHHRRLADASGLGLIAFSTRGQVYALEHLLDLAEIDGVVGLKDEWGDVRLFAEARARIGSRWAWINGMAEMQAAEYAVLGADAFTSGIVNVFPQLTHDVEAAVRTADWARLRELADRIRPFAALRGRRPGYSTAVIKEAMAKQGQPGGGRVRPPLAPVEPDDARDVAAVARELSAGVAA